jgi:hypothetical protein
MNQGIIDTYFKATNFEEGGDQEGNDDLSLVRFEFLEIWARIARGKFLDTGKVATMSEALELLITKHILPLKKELPAWQEFREKQMYQIDVNELIHANVKGLRALYD